MKRRGTRKLHLCISQLALDPFGLGNKQLVLDLCPHTDTELKRLRTAVSSITKLEESTGTTARGYLEQSPRNSVTPKCKLPTLTVQRHSL